MNPKDVPPALLSSPLLVRIKFLHFEPSDSFTSRLLEFLPWIWKTEKREEVMLPWQQDTWVFPCSPGWIRHFLTWTKIPQSMKVYFLCVSFGIKKSKKQKESVIFLWSALKRLKKFWSFCRTSDSDVKPSLVKFCKVF